MPPHYHDRKEESEETAMSNLHHLPQGQNLAPAKSNILDNSAQALNHTFYWQCLSPDSVLEHGSEIGQAIARDFGSLDEFKKNFTDAATSLVGSFWIWLVLNQKGKLEIVGTENEDRPIWHGQVPLLTCDVREHAYFLGYKDARPDYLQAFWKLVNWTFVNQQYIATIVSASADSDFGIAPHEAGFNLPRHTTA